MVCAFLPVRSQSNALVTDFFANTARLQELILYLAQMSEGDPSFGAVKLNKILFHSDFAYYLSHGRSISSQEYQKLNDGPAPKQMLPVLEELKVKSALAIADRIYFGHMQKRPVALREPDLTEFSGQEIAALDSYRDQTCTICVKFGVDGYISSV